MTTSRESVDVLYAGAAEAATRLDRARDGLAVTTVSGTDAALDALAGAEFDCVVGASAGALDLLRSVRDRHGDLPVVLSPPDGDEATAAQAVAADADAYVPRAEAASGEVAARVEEAAADHRERRRRRRERRFLEAAQSANPASIIVVDREGRCVWANDRARDRLGIDADGEAYRVGDTDIYDADGEFVPPDERPFLRVFETGEPVRDWECRLDLEGGERWISISAAPIDESADDPDHVVVTSRDVTERRRYQSRLERSRDELSAELDEVFARVSDAFFALDDEWRFTYVNERAEDLIGVRADEVFGERVWDVFPGAVDSRFEEEYRRAMRTQETVSFEEFFPPLEAWFEVQAYPSETGLSVYFRDVTERRERQRALEESRRRYRTLLDHFPNGAVTLFDHDLRYSVAGGEGLEVAGATPEGVEGRTIFEALPESLHERLEPPYRAALDGDSRTFELEYDDRTLQFRVVPVRDENGEVLGGMAISQDVTDRKERERELERYETIVETVQDGVYTVGADGRFTTVNEAYAEMTGYSREELRGAPVSTVVDEEVVGTARDLERELAAGERETAKLEADLLTADGETVPAEATFALLPEAGEEYERVGVVRDVTERERRERELESRARQQEAVADLGYRALGNAPLDDLFDEAVETVASVLDTDYCKVLDLDSERDHLLLRAGVGWKEGYVGEATVGTERDSQAGYTLLADAPVVVEDLAAETRFSGPDLLLDHGVTSGVSVALGPSDDPWGVLGTHDAARREFSEHEVTFVENVATVLTAAIARKLHERDLERYEVLIESVDDGVYVVDREGRYTLVNEAHADLLGHDREELLGAAVSAVHSEETVRRALELEERLEADGSGDDTVRAEFDLDRPDGETVPVEVTLTPLRTDDGAGHERAGVIRDISHHRAFENRLRAIHDATRDLFRVGVAAEVSEIAVDTATEVLDLSGVALYRYDEARDELYPERASEGSSLMRGRLPSVPADETSIVGHVFAAGETLRYGDVRESPYLDADPGETDMRSGLFVPIDDHGVLVVGSRTRDAFDDQTRQLVETVAANAAAAYDRVDREEQLRSQRERLSALNDLNSLVQGVAQAVVRQSDRDEIARLVCDRLADSESYAAAWLGRASPDGEGVDVGAESGVEVPLDEVTGSDGLAAEAVHEGEMRIERDARLDPPRDARGPRTRRDGHRSAAAVPITFEDERYGVLTVYAERPDAFGAEERSSLRRLGTIVAHAVHSVEREQRLRENERRYRTLAENLPNGAVTLVDTDLRYRAAAGGNLARLGVTSDEIEGQHAAELTAVPPDVRTRLAAAFEAALQGESVTFELSFRDRHVIVRVIPLRGDGEVYAAMSLSQDVTERERRERELEHERERLELMNRLIRHNLLNSLNVVDARLEMLSGRVDYEVDSHLQTARERTEEMIDLVETIRTLMNVVVEDNDPELGAVPLDEVLTDQVHLAREAFPEAEFDLDARPGVEVVADELLEEAVENLLTNAVQHNDAEPPRVAVEVADVGDEAVTVTVSDNGPGVPEDVRADVFEKGSRGFESPGTGFGLHLVHEIIDSYGGDVRVENGTGEYGGATFTLTLDLAPRGVESEA
ncbi:MAG: PAS domain-containing protein [Halobacteriaceae archaeon]